MSEAAPTTVALISRGLPRHTSMGVRADNPVELQRFADYVSTTTLTVEDLLGLRRQRLRRAELRVRRQAGPL